MLRLDGAAVGTSTYLFRLWLDGAAVKKSACFPVIDYTCYYIFYILTIILLQSQCIFI